MNFAAHQREQARCDPKNKQTPRQIVCCTSALRDATAANCLEVFENNQISAGNISKCRDNEFVMRFRKTPLWKRSIDVVLSVCLFVLLSPILLFIAGYILFRDGGPVLFRQWRLGSEGKSFVIYKFRTLKHSHQATADHRQFVAKLSSDNSVTTKPDLARRAIPGGVFLRSTSLDELPQLWNILRGDMSLIGPRPDVLQWEDYQPWQRKRFEVVPGVTGLWQVSGKNRLTFNQMIDKDIEYVENRSVWLDLTIALKTFRLIVQRDNI